MTVWNNVLVSTHLLAWSIVGAHEEPDIAELKRRLLEEQLNGPDVAAGTTIKHRQDVAEVPPCNIEDVVLSHFPQWEDEKGYWIGDYDFYQSDGEPNESALWPYPYKQYRGFITGNVAGPAYRQRNVFVYRPLPQAKCASYNGNLTTMFHGTCGTNGNTKLFRADQKVTNCSESADGSISGPYAGIFSTKTDLIGNDDTLLYQVSLNKDALGPSFPPDDCLFQSQLTTITRSSNGGQVYRTRSAQSFECFNPTTYGRPTYLSFYRERKVEREEFVVEMGRTFAEFNVTEGDTCAWEDDAAGNAVPSPYGGNPGIDSCLLHLNESFALGVGTVNGKTEESAVNEMAEEIDPSLVTKKTAEEEEEDVAAAVC